MCHSIPLWSVLHCLSPPMLYIVIVRIKGTNNMEEQVATSNQLSAVEWGQCGGLGGGGGGGGKVETFCVYDYVRSRGMDSFIGWLKGAFNT